MWIRSDFTDSGKSKIAAITGSTYVSHTHIIHTSTVQFVGLDNKGRANPISLQSCVEAEILRFFLCTSVLVEIFNLPLTATSESIHTSFADLLDPENVG